MSVFNVFLIIIKELEEPGADNSRFDNLLPSIVRPPLETASDEVV